MRFGFAFFGTHVHFLLLLALHNPFLVLSIREYSTEYRTKNEVVSVLASHFTIRFELLFFPFLVTGVILDLARNERVNATPFL
jgi:hypothetical protein